MNKLILCLALLVVSLNAQGYTVDLSSSLRLSPQTIGSNVNITNLCVYNKTVTLQPIQDQTTKLYTGLNITNVNLQTGCPQIVLNFVNENGVSSPVNNTLKIDFLNVFVKDNTQTNTAPPYKLFTSFNSTGNGDAIAQIYSYRIPPNPSPSVQGGQYVSLTYTTVSSAFQLVAMATLALVALLF